MIYHLEISEQAYKIFKKLSKKDKAQITTINRKIEQILRNPYHFKPLKGDRKGARRVHIKKSFVLIYEIDEEKKTVRVLDYNHHDRIYE